MNKQNQRSTWELVSISICHFFSAAFVCLIQNVYFFDDDDWLQEYIRVAFWLVYLVNDNGNLMFIVVMLNWLIKWKVLDYPGKFDSIWFNPRNKNDNNINFSPKKQTRRVHISEKTLNFLDGEFEIIDGDGASREEVVRLSGIKTYFITKIIKPVSFFFFSFGRFWNWFLFCLFPSISILKEHWMLWFKWIFQTQMIVER